MVGFCSQSLLMLFQNGLLQISMFIFTQPITQLNDDRATWLLSKKWQKKMHLGKFAKSHCKNKKGKNVKSIA